MLYLYKFVYLLPSTRDERELFGNTLINVWEDEERRTRAFSSDEGPVAELPHKSLDGLHIFLAFLDTTGDALIMVRERDYYSSNSAGCSVCMTASCCSA